MLDTLVSYLIVVAIIILATFPCWDWKGIKEDLVKIIKSTEKLL